MVQIHPYATNLFKGVLMSTSGKGDKRRPMQVSNAEYAARWDAIFGRDTEEESHSLDDASDIEEDASLEANKVS